MERVLYWLGDNWVQVCLAASLVIQISPIKWNPWSTLLNWVGKMLTKDVMREVGSIQSDLADVKKELKQHEREADENEMDRIRTEVLAFANSCRIKHRHTKEEFDHIFALNDKYLGLLAKYKKQNGHFDEAFDYIQTLYRKCMIENDFL